MRCSLVVNKSVSHLVAVLALLSLFTGCAGSSPITRYALSSSAPPSAISGDAGIVSMAEVYLPAYARDKPIASQGKGREVHLDASHRWAGYPSELVTAALVQALRGQGVNAVPAGQLAGLQADRRAIVTFDTFLRRRDGGARVSGSFVIVNTQRPPLSENFAIDVPGTSIDYDAYVRAVEESVSTLAKTMTEALQKSSPANEG